MPDVLPWDIAMNNRDRSDVGLWISYKRFDEALEQARADERERIIERIVEAWPWTLEDEVRAAVEGHNK